MAGDKLYNKTLTKMRELGIPPNFFDSDFLEQEAEARKRAEFLLKRIGELEESEQFNDVPLPWTRQKDREDDTTLDDYLCFSQWARPEWTRELRELNKWARGQAVLGRSPYRVKKQLLAGRLTLKPHHKCVTGLIALGIDPYAETAKAIAARERGEL